MTPATTDEMVLSLEHVSKHYPPPPPMRLRRFFARFRGLHIEEGFGADALSGQEIDDEEDVEDEGPEEVLPRQEEHAGRRVIDDVTLRLPAGSVVGLAGPAGAGKTVLLELAAGIVKPSEGRVVVRGSVAPALRLMTAVLPTKGHTVKSALPILAAMVGVPPGSSTSLMESRRKRELVLATALTLEPDILLLDIPILAGAFGTRSLERIKELQARGTLVVTELRDGQPTRLEPDRVVALERGRLLDDLGASINASGSP
jgi:ABC-type polysaccharide/polyol phosphate transport system ATPase subunit